MGNDAALPVGRQEFTALLARFGIEGGMNSDILADMMFHEEEGAAATLSASQKKELTDRLLLRMLYGQAARRPVLLLIEDIHWADPTTIELIDKIVASSADSRLLMILTGRPGASARLARPVDATYLRLSRLAKADSNLLVDEICAATPLSVEARQAIIDRAEGIPLFLEELTKGYLALDDEGAVRSAVPETLNDFLAAQLDRLGPARSVAQVAAVLGRNFSRDLLRAVIGDEPEIVDFALDQLLAAQILNRAKADVHGRFSFRHALLRDAAYASILEADRRDLHYRAAVTLVDAFPDISANHPEIIAEHMRDAGRPAEAIPFWIDAGQQSSMRYELAEATANFRNALDALTALSGHGDTRERELDVLLLLGSSVRNQHGYANVELHAIYTRARAVAEELGRANALASAIYGLWTYAAGRGHWAEASRLADEFQQLARSIEDNGQVEIESARLLGASATFRGQFALARDHLERGLRLYDIDQHGPRFGFDPAAASAAYLSWTLWHLGDVKNSDHWAQRALFIAEKTEHSSTLAMVLAWLIFHAVCRDDVDAIKQYNSRLQTLCVERDCRYWQPFGAACAEWAEFQQDRRPAHIDKLLAYTGAFEENYLTSCLLILAANLCAEAERQEEGMRLASQAQRFIEEHGERIWEAESNRIIGLLQLSRPNVDARLGAKSLRKALRIARDQGAVQLQRRAAASMEVHNVGAAMSSRSSDAARENI
jgi:hypothetical protein